MNLSNTCKNCRHWGKKMGNDCGRIDVSPGRGRATTATLRTDPDFGCTLFDASDAVKAEAQLVADNRDKARESALIRLRDRQYSLKCQHSIQERAYLAEIDKLREQESAIREAMKTEKTVD